MNDVHERNAALGGHDPGRVTPAAQVVTDHDVRMHLVNYLLDCCARQQREGVNGMPKRAWDKAASLTVERPEDIPDRVRGCCGCFRGTLTARFQAPVVHLKAGAFQLLSEGADNALSAAETGGRHHGGQLQDDPRLRNCVLQLTVSAVAVAAGLGLSLGCPPSTALVNDLQGNGDEESDDKTGQGAHRDVDDDVELRRVRGYRCRPHCRHLDVAVLDA
jgi:hypothetical protein